MQLKVMNPSKITTMKTLHFDNRFLRELPGDPITKNHTRQVQNALWSRVAPTPVATPHMLASGFVRLGLLQRRPQSHTAPPADVC